MRQMRVRFAPSPTGDLHLGSARTAEYNWLAAQHYQGKFILRIEDTDALRSKKEFELSIMEGLRWLGLDWDEGPDIGGPHAPYRQSERYDIYRKKAFALLEEGLAYHCWCTPEELDAQRKEALAKGEPPHYKGRCRNLSSAEKQSLSAGRDAAIRFIVTPRDILVDDILRGQIRFPAESSGDFIILRADGSPSYNFSVVIDDADMEITHVLRGEDLLPSTGRQLLIYRAIEKDAPVFLHLGVILGPDGGKLSKRHGATSVSEYKNMGYLPDAIVNFLALLGWSHPHGREILSEEDLVSSFTFDRLHSSPAVCDIPKLKWLNGKHLDERDAASILEMARPFLVKTGIEVEQLDAVGLDALIENVKTRVDTLEDLAEDVYPVLQWNAGSIMDSPFVGEAVGSGAVDLLRESIGKWEAWDIGSLDEALTQLKIAGKARGFSAGKLLKPLRILLTGREHGPEIKVILAFLGKEETLRRLSVAK